MSDGQSFYLVLVAFYLLECVKFAPPNSLAMLSGFRESKTWKPRTCFIMAWGVGKSVFIGPLLPWPSLVYIVTGSSDSDHANKRIRTASGIRRWTRFLTKATNNLRWISLGNLSNFLILLPVVYSRFGDSNIILFTIGYCYLTLFATAIHLHALHRRIFPRNKADRYKATFYTAFLPWHAMRCADEFFLKSSLNWSSLTALAANAENPAALETLKRLWRSSHFQANASYKTETLTHVLDRAGLDRSDWLNSPSDSDSPLYCPCCHVGYESVATHCADCKDVALEKFVHKT